MESGSVSARVVVPVAPELARVALASSPKSPCTLTVCVLEFKLVTYTAG